MQGKATHPQAPLDKVGTGFAEFILSAAEGLRETRIEFAPHTHMS